MEYIKYGSLQDLIKNSPQQLPRKRKYDNTARQKILIGIAWGMKYLHRNRIMHRDLKPGNILVDDNFQPIIADFGLSKIYPSESELSQSQNNRTFYYMAPEIFKTNRYNYI